MTQLPEPATSGMAHLQAVGAAFIELTQKVMADPMAVATSAAELWGKYALAWHKASQRVLFPATKAKVPSSDPQGQSLGRACDLRIYQGNVSDLRRIDPESGAQRQGARSQDRTQSRLLHQAIC